MKIRLLALVLFTMAAGLLPAQMDCEAEWLGGWDGSSFQYLKIKVKNSSLREQKYSLAMARFDNKGLITIQDQSVGAGETRIHHVSLPNNIHTQVRFMPSEGGEKLIYPKNEVSPLLHIAPMEKWLNPTEVSDFVKVFPNHGFSTITQIEPDALPDKWLCHASFCVIFLEESSLKRASSTGYNQILSWVDAGGMLVIYNAENDSYEAKMFGTIRHMKSRPFNPFDTLEEWKSGTSPWNRFCGSMIRDSSPYAVHEGAGKIGVFLLVTLFVIIAGPVNYFHFRSRKRLRRLLVSLPLLSAGFCLLIVLYFVGTQGFARRGGTVSLALLDEKTNRGFAYSSHCLYSGLYPMGGFRFDEQTLFMPMIQDQSFFRQPRGLEYDMDITAGLNLKSGLFKPLENFEYLTATPFQTRENLIYEPERKTVTNGFEKPIRGLVLEDAGSIYFAERIKPGEAASLKQQTGTSLEETFRSLMLNNEERRFFVQKMGTLLYQQDSQSPAEKPGGAAQVRYMIRFEENPAYAKSGVRFKKAKICPVLIGEK
ncbi:MAG TPA: hypothetical protein PLB62_11440 [Candidatus Sumerlaeota bacterium]|nr:hypothetical protein [Candidatus Sumerlaeota bacterium]